MKPDKVTPSVRQKVAQATEEGTEAIDSNLQMGYQMKEALVASDHRYAEVVYDRAAENPKMWAEGAPFSNASSVLVRLREIAKAPSMEEFTALDAVMILSAINVGRDEAVAANGPELIQDKLSAAAAG